MKRTNSLITIGLIILLLLAAIFLLSTYEAGAAPCNPNYNDCTPAGPPPVDYCERTAGMARNWTGCETVWLPVVYR